MAEGVGSLSERSTLDDRRRASASFSVLSLASVVVAWMPVHFDPISPRQPQ